MFGRYLIATGAIWLVILGCSAYMMFFTNNRGDEKYHTLLSRSNHQKKNSKRPDGETRQTRNRVSKQIILNRGSHRDESRLTSEKSELVLHNKGGGVELIEYFQDICCVQQEKLFILSQDSFIERECDYEQLIRQLLAKEAIYSYRTGLLEAKDVEFTRFLCPGKSWPSVEMLHSPMMRGIASSIAIKLAEEPTFKAEGFQATFHDWWEQ